MCYHYFVKSDEFNNVKVTNEKNTFGGEFTKAQKSEYSFQNENPTTIKDELNDTQTINDDPEENLLKSTKEKKEKKQENKELESSSTSGAEASSASSASAAASSAGGTVAGIAASAATAAVVVIGAVAGISIIEQQKEQEDLITFVSSDITADSIDFIFRMPASLLFYEEDPTTGGDTPRKQIIGYVENSDGYYASQEFGFEDIDEYTKEGYGYFDGLSAGTTYALTIMLVEYFYSETEEIVENPTQLAFRTFTTLTADQLITFTSFEVTYNSVDFAFTVALSDIGYTPGSQDTPNGYATLGDRSLTLTDFSLIDDEHAEVRGGFTGLDPETSYKLEIYVEIDRVSKFLGSREFTTLERTTTFSFGDITVERTNVSFSYTISKEEVGYQEGSTPALRHTISDGADFYRETWLEEYDSDDPDILTCYGTFDELPLNSSFTLSIGLSTEQEIITLGETTFDNLSGFRWVIDPTKQVTATTTFFNFAIKASYIGYISEEETPDVISHISAVVTTTGGEEVGAYRPSAINPYGSTYVTCLGNIDSLNPETEYTLTIYYIEDNQQQVELGSYDFTTIESAGGFKFLNIESGDTYVEISFQINSSEVTEIEEGVYSIQMKISHGATHIDTINVNQWSESDVEGKVIGTVNIQDLPANTEYHVEVYSWSTGSTFGSTDFVTDQTVYNFNITDQTITHESLDVEFYVNAAAFDIDWTDASAVRELEDKIYMEYRTSEGESYPPQYAYNLERTPSDVAEGQFNITGLTANTKYIATIYYDSANGLIPLGMYDFETGDTPPGINSILSNYEVFEAGDGYFRMPITISYEGDTSTYGNYFILLFTVAGLSDPFTATVPVAEGPQYAKFAERTVLTYLGSTVSYTVVCENDMDTVLYEVDSATFFDTDTSGINSFYGLKDYSNEVQYSGGVVNFSFMPVCAIGNRSLEASIVFTTTNGLEYEYAIDLTYFNAIDNLSIDLLTEKDSGGTSMTYDMLKDGFEGQTLNITIRYYTSATTGDIYEVTVVNDYSFMFSFLN